MPNKANTVTQKAIAELFGVSREAVFQWVQKGMPTRHGGYIPSECVQWRRDQDLAEKRDKPDLALEQARKLRADADMAELRLAERRGELVPAADVEQEMERLCMALRARVIGMRGRFAPRVLGLGTMPEATAVLDEIAANLLAALKESAEEIEGDDAEDADAA